MGVQDLGQLTVVVFHSVAFVHNHILPTNLQRREEERGVHLDYSSTVTLTVTPATWRYFDKRTCLVHFVPL